MSANSFRKAEPVIAAHGGFAAAAYAGLSALLDHVHASPGLTQVVPAGCAVLLVALGAFVRSQVSPKDRPLVDAVEAQVESAAVSAWPDVEKAFTVAEAIFPSA